MAQDQLDGNTRSLPQGKVLGGGSILNGMVWSRGGADDYNAWETLGNPGWNWDALLPYFMKVRIPKHFSLSLPDAEKLLERDVHTISR